jgi:hypothetical protein
MNGSPASSACQGAVICVEREKQKAFPTPIRDPEGSKQAAAFGIPSLSLARE